MLAAWCGWVSGLHRSTTPARITWGVSLAAVVLVNLILWQARRRSWRWRLKPVADPWPRPGRQGARRVLIGVSPWLVLIVVVAAWEALGIDTGPHQAHLTISALSQAFRWLNAALLASWILLGIGYGAARAKAPLAHPGASEQPSQQSQRSQPALVATGLAPPPPPALLLANNRAVGVAFWIAVLAACLIIDLAARRSGGRLANGEELIRWVTGPRLVNVVLVLAWAYAGWHLFAH